MNYEDLLTKNPFSLCQKEKEEILLKGLLDLTEQHQRSCVPYGNILNALGFKKDLVSKIENIPFIPVRLFKELELRSIADDEVFKVMTSSGTTGQKVSRIYLDRKTANNQQKTLVKIVSDFTGNERLPMLIIDSPSVVKNRAMFSARGAGILGFSIFGKDRVYALDDDMNIKLEIIQDFLEKHCGEKILLFGFTFMVWQHFYKSLKNMGEYLPMEHAILIHGGGWKKLSQEAVSPKEFHERLREVCGIKRVCDYYGMVEQTGCIYMECEEGHLHSSIYSDVLIRRGIDFSTCDIGEKGIIQVLSPLAESYPGHSLLTEDEGVLMGIDDCPCGRKGKYFRVLGRLKNAELRGCSDTYADKFQS